VCWWGWVCGWGGLGCLFFGGFGDARTQNGEMILLLIQFSRCTALTCAVLFSPFWALSVRGNFFRGSPFPTCRFVPSSQSHPPKNNDWEIVMTAADTLNASLSRGKSAVQRIRGEFGPDAVLASSFWCSRVLCFPFLLYRALETERYGTTTLALTLDLRHLQSSVEHYELHSQSRRPC